MPLWLQHLLVLLLVAGCLGYVGWQGFRSLAGRRSRIGSCCAKGCQTPATPASSAQRIHFLPAEMLRKRR
jgi:hypothetical protein